MFTPCCRLRGTKDAQLIVDFSANFFLVVATRSLLLLPYLATAIANAAATAMQEIVGWLSPFSLPECHLSLSELSFHSCHCHTAWHGVKKPVDCSLLHHADIISSLFFSPCCRTCTTTDMPIDCSPVVGFYLLSPIHHYFSPFCRICAKSFFVDYFTVPIHNGSTLAIASSSATDKFCWPNSPSLLDLGPMWGKRTLYVRTQWHFDGHNRLQSVKVSLLTR